MVEFDGEKAQLPTKNIGHLAERANFENDYI